MAKGKSKPRPLKASVQVKFYADAEWRNAVDAICEELQIERGQFIRECVRTEMLKRGAKDPGNYSRGQRRDLA